MTLHALPPITKPPTPGADPAERLTLAWLLEDLIASLEHYLGFAEESALASIADALNALRDRPWLWPRPEPAPDDWRNTSPVDDWLGAHANYEHDASIAIQTIGPNADPTAQLTSFDVICARSRLHTKLHLLITQSFRLTAYVVTTAVLARDETRLSDPSLSTRFDRVAQRCDELVHDSQHLQPG